jgi:uncharacterized protein (DUF2126 family)
MEQYQNYLKQQKFYRRKEKTTEKEDTSFELDLLLQQCIEERDGMSISPPTDYLEDYVDLITSIEITAEKSYKCQCVLKVTNLKLIIELKNDGNSDPGVIEVNVHLQKHGKRNS